MMKQKYLAGVILVGAFAMATVLIAISPSFIGRNVPVAQAGGDCPDRTYSAVTHGVGYGPDEQTAMNSAITNANNNAASACASTYVSCSPPQGCFPSGNGQRAEGPLQFINFSCDPSPPNLVMCSVNMSTPCVQVCGRTLPQ